MPDNKYSQLEDAISSLNRKLNSTISKFNVKLLSAVSECKQHSNAESRNSRNEALKIAGIFIPIFGVIITITLVIADSKIVDRILSSKVDSINLEQLVSERIKEYTNEASKMIEVIEGYKNESGNLTDEIELLLTAIVAKKRVLEDMINTGRNSSFDESLFEERIEELGRRSIENAGKIKTLNESSIVAIYFVYRKRELEALRRKDPNIQCIDAYEPELTGESPGIQFQTYNVGDNKICYSRSLEMIDYRLPPIYESMTR